MVIYTTSRALRMLRRGSAGGRRVDLHVRAARRKLGDSQGDVDPQTSGAVGQMLDSWRHWARLLGLGGGGAMGQVVELLQSLIDLTTLAEEADHSGLRTGQVAPPGLWVALVPMERTQGRAEGGSDRAPALITGHRRDAADHRE
jgi:hypothetical protein